MLLTTNKWIAKDGKEVNSRRIIFITFILSLMKARGRVGGGASHRREADSEGNDWTKKHIDLSYLVTAMKARGRCVKVPRRREADSEGQTEEVTGQRGTFTTLATNILSRLKYYPRTKRW